MFKFDQFHQAVNALVGLAAGQPENFGVETEQFLGREKFVIVSHFRQIADALARDGLADVNPEQARRSAGWLHKTKQDVHRRGFARAVRPEETKDFAGADFEVQAGERNLRRLTHFAAAVFDTQFVSF